MTRDEEVKQTKLMINNSRMSLVNVKRNMVVHLDHFNCILWFVFERYLYYTEGDVSVFNIYLSSGHIDCIKIKKYFF